MLHHNIWANASGRLCALICLMIVITATGCRSARCIRDPEFAQEVDRIDQVAYQSPVTTPIESPVSQDLSGQNSVDVYIHYALSQNPDIQASRKNIEAAAFRVPQVSSLQDPIVSMSAYPESVQTAAGEQQFKLDVKQKFPWHGKLRSRANAAEANTNVARAQLAATELAVIEKVKLRYYEIYYLQKAIGITETDRKVLFDLTRLAQMRYRAAQVSQQDVLNAQLAVSEVDADLIRLHQQLRSAQAKLARQLHISPSTPVLALENLSAAHIPANLQSLHLQALQARPELHATLAAINRDRHIADQARLDYFPDVTLGMTWIDTSKSGISPVANGDDAFLVGLSVNVPIYRKRLEAGVREAEARAVATARRYDSLKDQTEEEVHDLFVKAQSQQDLLQLFRDQIIPKAEQTLKVSTKAYETGGVDFLQLIDNWRQLWKYQLSYQQLESQLRQTLASLEKIIGSYELHSETLPNHWEPREFVDPEALEAPPEPNRSQSPPISRLPQINDSDKEPYHDAIGYYK